MNKILHIARREFLATAGTRAFIVGVFITPVLIGALMLIMSRMVRQGPPALDGTVGVIDPTGQVADGMKAFLEPARIEERRQKKFERIQQVMPQALRSAADGARAAAGPRAGDPAAMLGTVPHLRVVALDPEANVDAAKRPLAAANPREPRPDDLLALVVVHANAVRKTPGKVDFGSYDFFVRGKLDSRVTREIGDAARDAIVTARVKQSGLDRKAIDELTTVDEVPSRTVTAAGEGQTSEVLNQMIPMALLGLVLMAVMMSGQYLLTTTIEEKSSRVVEVLLSAVSPMELMVGKILGQFAVGLLLLTLYMGLGLVALLSFASLGLLDPKLIVFLLVFFLLAYLSVGAFMAAIGSAVNELREAQGLMMPAMMVFMIPWFLWMPISRDPNSTLATVLSFVPPLSNFVIILRLASSSPPPLWQTLLAVLAGAAGVAVSLWFAAKVFRIGLLMYGKPPSFATLVRWARLG
jgi:ABC-type Na+ efflux pump permease subunit